MSAVLLLAFVNLLAAKPSGLADAVKQGSAYWVTYYLENSPSLNETATLSLLAKAVESGDFNMTRAFLLNGVNVARFMEKYPELVEEFDPTQSDALAMHYLIRTYDFAQKYARPLPDGYRIDRSRVAVYEPTVDYTHPEISPNYYINKKELDGEKGVDDDRNGFVDDVYGWSPFRDGPHEPTSLQVSLWKEGKPLIKKVLDLYNRVQMGELDEDSMEYSSLYSSYTNPLAAVWGEGYSDYQFMEDAVEISHGSHVAGIIIDNSLKAAQIHTLSWDAFGRPSGQHFDILKPIAGETYKQYRLRFGEANMKLMVEKGRETSDYLRVHGISVVNASFGMSVGYWIHIARDILMPMSEYDPEIEENFTDCVLDLAYEMYAYNSIPYTVVASENPQILFVVAAGNDDEDNDDSLTMPAYLSRFFSNVITVGASNSIGDASSFSNFGVQSVNVAAPGVDIESHGIAGSRILMDGTSMAAPAVAGHAVVLRNEFPKVSPRRLRYAMELSADLNESWDGLISCGGNMNVEAARALLNQEGAAVRNALWSGVLSSKPDDRPIAWSSAINALATCRTEHPNDAEVVYAYAVGLDVSGDSVAALGMIDRSLGLASSNQQYWKSKVIILRNLENELMIVATVEDFLESSAYEDDANTADVYQIIEWGVEAAKETNRDRRAELWASLLPDDSSLADSPSESSGATDDSRLEASEMTQERVSSLNVGDLELSDGSLAEVYEIFLREGDEYIFDLQSSDFDPYLVVISPSGEELENDDYNESAEQSQINAVADVSGHYKVYATSYSPGATGSYWLQWVIESAARRTQTLSHPMSAKVSVDMSTFEKSIKKPSASAVEVQ